MDDGLSFCVWMDELVGEWINRQVVGWIINGMDELVWMDGWMGLFKRCVDGLILRMNWLM